MRPGPLEAVVVVELAHYAAAPFATMQLADAGARVIKVEQVGRGEHYRRSGSQIPTADGGSTGAYFLRLNRNKESVALDTRSPEGYAILLDLLRRADVLLTNLLPETLRAQGLDYETLHEQCPRLVYTSISGFGHEETVGDLATRPAFASVAEARSGFMLQVGDPTCRPHRSGTSLADLAGGLYAALGTSFALHHRDRTGEGQHVDIALYDAMVAFNERAIFTTAMTGVVPTRGSEGAFCPFDPYPTADGWIVVCTMTDEQWRSLCRLIGSEDLPDDERYADGPSRSANRTVVDERITAWTTARTTTEAEQQLAGAGVPGAAVLDAAGVVEDPQALSRGMVTTVRDPYHGDHVVVGSPMRLSNDIGRPATPPPPLGNATDAVLGELLELGPDDLARLRGAGLIQ